MSFESSGVTESSLLAPTLDLTGAMTSRGKQPMKECEEESRSGLRTGIACGRLCCP